MAYSKVLEELIEAALADGVLTDKERAVLHKRAQQEGVDPEELDVVIEGRLAKMKREVDWLRPTPPANEKHGNVVKCPNCGATVEAGTVKCKECGFEFRNVRTNQSVSLLYDSIMDINNSDLCEDEKLSRINTVISNFPIPTTKEDILEFLSIALPNAEKKGNLITKYPAVSGFVIGIIGLILLGSGLGLSNEENGFIEAVVSGTLLLTFAGGGFAPFVLAFIMQEMLERKTEDLSKANARADAWRFKCIQVLSKARISLAGDPDLQRIEEIARNNGF